MKMEQSVPKRRHINSDAEELPERKHTTKTGLFITLFIIRHNFGSINRLMHQLYVFFCNEGGLLQKHYVAPFMTFQ
jgi:hypothetical protein